MLIKIISYWKNEVKGYDVTVQPRTLYLLHDARAINHKKVM